MADDKLNTRRIHNLRQNIATCRHSTLDTQFPDWLLEQMNKRGWSQSDLARAAGVDRQVVSNYINRRRANPDPDVLTALAHALKISPIAIFRAAGLLPREGGEQINFEDWRHLLSQLSPEDQDEIRRIVEMKIEKYGKDKGLKKQTLRKAG